MYLSQRYATHFKAEYCRKLVPEMLQCHTRLRAYAKPDLSIKDKSLRRQLEVILLSKESLVVNHPSAPLLHSLHRAEAGPCCPLDRTPTRKASWIAYNEWVSPNG